MPIKGEVWDINLMPEKESTEARTRPCVVISNDQMNTKLGSSIVIPLGRTGLFTKSGKLSPATVEISPTDSGLDKVTFSMSFQVGTISHSRFTKKLGVISQEKMLEIMRSVNDLTAS
jgi:mRNA-degrading endonuclease toxin of MazEF toxin-antitoxin module